MPAKKKAAKKAPKTAAKKPAKPSPKPVPKGRMRVKFLRVGCDPGEEPFVVGETYDLTTESAVRWIYRGACEPVE